MTTYYVSLGTVEKGNIIDLEEVYGNFEAPTPREAVEKFLREYDDGMADLVATSYRDNLDLVVIPVGTVSTFRIKQQSAFSITELPKAKKTPRKTS